MLNDSLLIGYSQLGAVFVGFISIVVVFVRDDGKLSPVDALRVRSILHASILIIAGGVAPLTLQSYALSPDSVLRISSALILLIGVGMAIEGAIFNARMTASDRKKGGLIHGVFTWGLSMSALILLALVASGYSVLSGHYVCALSLGIAVASSNFVMIALQKWLTG